MERLLHQLQQHTIRRERETYRSSSSKAEQKNGYGYGKDAEEQEGEGEEGTKDLADRMSMQTFLSSESWEWHPLSDPLESLPPARLVLSFFFMSFCAFIKETIIFFFFFLSLCFFLFE